MKPILLAMCAATSVAGGAADLYNNGPLVTNPGAGFGGADVSAIQTTLGSSLPGYGIQLGGGNRVADDFTVPAGGWRVDSVKVYLFQPNSGVTPTINDVRLQIWNGRPDLPGSQVVFGDMVNNRLSAVSFSNVYRAPDNGLTATNRPIMTCTVQVGVNLAPGTYWLDISADGSAAQGPFAPPVTRPGQAGAGNALQFFGSSQTWNQLYDPGGVWLDDLPFVLINSGGVGPQAVFPALLTLSPGIALSGGLIDLYTSNDQRMVMRPGVVFVSSQRPIQLVLEGYAPSPTGSSLQFVVESQVSGVSINQRVEAYNFNFSSYVTLDARNLTTADQVLTLSLSPPAHFIGPSNTMRVRISYAATAAVFSFPWLARVDEATWRFSP
jgi:hypothetical protein